MKNISLTINPSDIINSLSPPPAYPNAVPLTKITTVSMNTQFDSEHEALAFTMDLLQMLANFQIQIAKVNN